MKKLVILGGGYGGMKIMQQLSAKDLPEDYEIVLVDKLPYHCIKTEYYALAAGTESDHDIRVPFPKHVRRHFGHVQHIDVESRTITLSGDQHDPETLSYDKLVIGLGAEDKYTVSQGLASIHIVFKAWKAQGKLTKPLVTYHLALPFQLSEPDFLA